MSNKANTSATTAAAAAAAAAGNSSNIMLSKDGTQIIYSWLPHSTALGASSTVAIRVRNVNNVCQRREELHNYMPTTLQDEKKYSESSSSGESSYSSDYLECRVEASIHSMGLPLQAAPISTKYTSLVPYYNNTNNNNNTSLYAHHHSDFACGRDWGTATFDTLLSLPVRWRDLTRDACLTLNVYCDGITTDNDNNDATKVLGTTLPLFDQNGRLRSGLYKLKLHPNMLADGGMSYQSMGCNNEEDGNEEMNIESFLHGGATPGISNNPQSTQYSYSDRWFDGKKLDCEDEDDPKWKASLILHELNRLESTPGTPGTNHHTLQQASSQRQTSWLDALTRERCVDILNEQEDSDYYSGGAPLQHNHHQQQQKRNNSIAPTSSHHNTPYLIIELPTPPIPILHEEPIYPVETSTHLRGTTGSITANELIKFHSKFQTEDESNNTNNGLTVRISPAAVELPASSLSSEQPQAFLYPLVQTLDHEPPLADENENPQDNPAQDKYRILAHDLIRGLVDPGLKPDRVQRGRLERIVGSPSYHLSTEEKDLLWRFRFSLVDNRRALTKFLLAVDWTVESEVVQAAELLEQWRKRSPIEVTDALKLLGRNVAFQTSLVRSYAIETLSDAPDEELRLYLLQLVQALKYEEDISGGVSGGNSNVANAFSHMDKGGDKPKRVSSLSSFLIERASHNIELANFLYWYLKAELENPTYEARYKEVFVSFKEQLSSVRVSNGSIIPQSQALLPESNTITLWELLSEQDKFISGILACQISSLDIRGKKDAKETHLRELLEAGGFHKITHAVPLPSAPHIWVNGVNCQSAKMFKSALYPAVLDFFVDHTTSPAGLKQTKTKQKDEKKTYKVMIKTGDDLRQDQLVIMMIQLMDGLLKRGTLDLCLRPYSILAMPNNTGLLEFVERSIPVSQILSGHNNSIIDFFQSVAPQEGASHSVKPDVLQTYIRSCAGYCVLTYLLGVGDRHLDNIMIQPTGHFFHIDFGFIFGRDPKPLPPAFRLTKEMVDGMGGTDSKEYKQFCSLACQAFNVLRKSAGLQLNLLHLMSDAGIEDLSHNPSADAIGIISKVEERFKLELSDEQAEQYFIGLINECVSALAPRVMEVFHQLAVARR